MNIHLPASLDDDIDEFDDAVRRFESGTLSPDDFKHKRVIWGIYEQRQDGLYMLRTRIPGGRIPAARARVIARLAQAYRGVRLHVSTRENIQFHDLKVEELVPLMRELKAAGITCKGGGGNTARNVVGCPHAGLCPRESFDVTPYVTAVTEHLIHEPGSYTLPRKFKVAFSGCPDDCALATVTDVGFVAHVRDGQPGFAVYGGGGMGGAPRLGEPLADWIPARDCVRATEAVRRLFDRLGDRTNRARARLRFAVAKLPPNEFRTLFAQEFESLPLPPLNTDHRTLPPLSPLPPLNTEHRTLNTLSSLPTLPQRQAGLVSLRINLPFGHITGPELELLADLADQYSTARELRATPDQKLLIPSVKEADLPSLTAALAPHAATWLAPGALNRIVACTGAATCRLGICNSQEAARAIAIKLDEASLPGEVMNTLDIRLNGCPNCCGQHPVGDIGLSGVLQKQDGQPVHAYRLHLGARRGEGQTRFSEFIDTIPARSLPSVITELLRDYAANRQGHELLPDYYDRMGKSYFQTRVRLD